MLIGEYTFDAQNMKELVLKVETGNYFFPSTLSMEALSFLDGMLKYDPKKRFTIEELYRHQFLNKNVKDFHKINLNKIKENVANSKIKMNTKLNQYICNIPEEATIEINKKKYEWNKINNDFIYIEPKVIHIPIIPGNDPSTMDIQSEFKYDIFNFNKWDNNY